MSTNIITNMSIMSMNIMNIITDMSIITNTGTCRMFMR